MANDTNIPIMGRLTGDPELRFTPSGAAVAGFTVAVTPRRFNRQTNDWEDKETQFWRCNAWNHGKLTLAENVVEGLKKGDSVIVFGEVEARKYETKQGERREAMEIRVESIGKDLKFHKPPISQTSKPPQSGGGWNAPASDPWATGDAPVQPDPWGNGNNGNGWG